MREKRRPAGTCDDVQAVKQSLACVSDCFHLLRTFEKETTTCIEPTTQLQVNDQLKTEELLLSDYPTYTTFPAHRPFVSTWVLPRLLDKTLKWLC